MSGLGSLHHDGSGRYVVACPGVDAERLRIGDRVRSRVRAAPDAPIERLLLRWTPDGEQVFVPMVEADVDPAARWWEVELELAMPSTGYRFLALTGDGPRWLNGSGIHTATPTDRDDFVLVAGYDPPRWLADRVVYQIFPDRFANGDPTNDVGGRRLDLSRPDGAAHAMGCPADTRHARDGRVLRRRPAGHRRRISTISSTSASARSTSRRSSTAGRTTATTSSTTSTWRRTSAGTMRSSPCARRPASATCG